ncbi:MAG: hypothetical protein JKX95_00300 [Bacteroidia bacterium]|nr:hypothetical protein [Bacteroidia bacterium]
MKLTYFSKDEIDFNLQDLPTRPEPLNILLSTPDHFQIKDSKNPFTNLSVDLDKEVAIDQWNNLRSTYEELADKNILEDITVLDSDPKCEDMVFCANQTFPWILNDGSNVVVLSKMRHMSRQNEIIHFSSFFESIGYQILLLNNTDCFEGMGDAIPHPSKKLIYLGNGQRTSENAVKEISSLLEVPIISLRLINEYFYHLDTCFLPVSENTVLLCSSAFSNKAIDLIHSLFNEVIDIPEKEAINFFSLNTHCITSSAKVAIIQKGTTTTKEVLIDHGFEVIELQTTEFMKSGGSVYCMKMAYY